MKYIVMSVINKSELELEVPFIFPDIVVHLHMSTVCKTLLELHFPGSEIKPISAGFVSSTAFEDDCYGKSESLNLPSRPERDSQLIKMCDYGSMYA